MRILCVQTDRHETFAVVALVAFCTTIAAQLPDYVPPSQLDAWFSLDGDGADESGNGNRVEALGAATRMPIGSEILPAAFYLMGMEIT